MTTFAVVAMGEMGSAIAARLVVRGATVLTSLAGRSDTSAERAKKAGVEPVRDDELVARADVLLSVVPPDAAAATADRFRALARGTAFPVFVDCNAVASQTVKAIARPFLKASLLFVDASIIGGPPRGNDAGPRLYVSGEDYGTTDVLCRFGLDARRLGGAPGDASALKMSYAGFTKGFQAIGASMALGAGRNGAVESLIEELKLSQPELYAWLCRQLPRMHDKAYRWDGEMREIARFLEPEAGAAAMFTGAAELYRHVAEANRAGPDSEVISLLRRFVEANP